MLTEKEEPTKSPGQPEPNREYEDLANAIILTAVYDYRFTQRELKAKPQNKMAVARKKEIEKFFKSEWFKELTDVNPHALIRKLESEVPK